MKQWLKDQWPTFIAILLGVVILYFLFHRSKDNGSALTQYQIEEIQAENRLLKAERDSLLHTVAPVIIPNDSLQQVAIDLNKKIINELRKKNFDRIDTVSGEELRSIFATYRRQFDSTTH